MEKIKIEQHSVGGLLWVSGWLFTIGFLKLTFWKGVLAGNEPGPGGELRLFWQQRGLSGNPEQRPRHGHPEPRAAAGFQGWPVQVF